MIATRANIRSMYLFKPPFLLCGDILCLYKGHLLGQEDRELVAFFGKMLCLFSLPRCIKGWLVIRNFVVSMSYLLDLVYQMNHT